MAIDKDSMEGQLEFTMPQNIPSVRMGSANYAADNADYPSPDGDKNYQSELEEMLYARHAEVSSYADLATQRGTPIPAMFNQFYKYIQNPSSVSVETFKRMVDTDDTIGSGVDFLTTCLAARVGRYEHPNKTITEYINKRLDEIDGGWFNCIKKMLSASWAGFSVSEKVWANTDNGFVPKRIVTLPPGTVLFETDRTGEITDDGILQYQRNYNPALFGTGSSYLFGFNGFSLNASSGNTIRPDGLAKLGDLPFPIRTANTYSYLSIRIPRVKVIHYSFDAQGNFENPYGRSMLRRCYKWYVMKDAFLQMLAVALDRKGTPLTVVFADPNVTLQDSNKTQLGTNQKGNKNVGIRADQAANQAFKNVHNDTTIILPGKKGQIYDVQFIANDANVSGFVESIKLCDQAILRALLIPALVFMGGDGSGSYALGDAHVKTFDKILDGMLSSFTHVLVNQLVYEMVAYNFPREDWIKDGLGSFGKRELSQEERDKELTSLKTAWEMGAIDPQGDLNDRNKVRESVGFEPTDELPEPQLLPGMEGDGGDGSDGGEEDGVGVSGKQNPPNSKGGSKGDAGKE